MATNPAPRKSAEQTTFQTVGVGRGRNNPSQPPACFGLGGVPSMTTAYVEPFSRHSAGRAGTEMWVHPGECAQRSQDPALRRKIDLIAMMGIVSAEKAD